VGKTLALLSQVYLTMTVQAEELNTLTGVGFKDSGSFSGLSHLSLGGGAPITIKGSDMAAMPNLNFVMAEPQWLDGYELYAPAITADEEFNSNAASGRISYETPSVMSLFSADFTNFDGEFLPNGADIDLNFDLKVANGETENSVVCADSSDCTLQYKRNATPLLLDSIPSDVVKGDTVQFVINPKDAHKWWATPSAEWPYRSFKLGNTLMNTDDQYMIYSRMSSWTNNLVGAVVNDQFPAQNTEPKVLFWGGYAINMPSSMHCSFEGEDCWRVKTHAKIENIDHNSGLTTGSQTLTINGFGLNGTDVSVLVDGVPCEVQEAVSEKIMCVTGVKDEISATGFQPGNFGLNLIKKADASTYEDLDSNVTYSVTE